MANEKPKKEALHLNVVYIGKDDNYVAGLKERFSRMCSTVPLTVKKIYPKKNEQGKRVFRSLFEKLIALPIDIIYFDFTTHAGEVLQLARIISRNNIMSKVVSVGLLDHLATEQEIVDSILSGVNFSHIKCAEMHDVVYDPVALFNSKLLQEPEYARAKMADPIKIKEFCRVNALNVDYLTIEYNRPLEEGTLFNIEAPCLKKFVPSNLVEVDRVSQSNVYYNMKYRMELELKYLERDRLDVSEPDQKREVESEIADIRHRLYKWTQENAAYSRSSKGIKILVISKNPEFLTRASRNLEEYPYFIRYQPLLTDISKELDVMRPTILAIQLETVTELPMGEDENGKETTRVVETPDMARWNSPIVREIFNDENALGKIVNAIQGFDGYTPFVLAFGCRNYDSIALQQKFGYPKIMGVPSNFKLETLIMLSENLEKKWSQTPPPKQMTKMRHKEVPLLDVFFDKKSPDSIAQVEYPIVMQSMKEHEITFSSPAPVAIGSVFKVSTPVPFFATVVPHSAATEKEAGKESFRALIHGIGEEEKKELRRFINSVFFREHDAKKVAEVDEFKKKNKEAEEVLKKQLEEEQKLKAKKKKELANDDETEEV